MKKIAIVLVVFVCASCASLTKVSHKDAAQQYVVDQTQCVKGSVVLVGSSKNSDYTDWHFTSCKGSVTVRQTGENFMMLR